MIFDKLSLFADKRPIPVTASTSHYSKVLDLRKCGQIGVDGFLRIWAGIIGTANTTGTVSTKLQTSANGTSWEDVGCASGTQSGNELLKCFVPATGLKRFIRLVFSVGSTQLGAAIVVKAGLVDEFDMVDIPTVQTYPPLEDLNTAADALEKALTVSATTATITKGSSGTVTVNDATICTIEKPASGYTVTQSGTTVTIALTAAATDGTVSFIDGLGNKLSVAVTAASAD